MKIVRKSILFLALGMLMVGQSGCFGEFALTRKVYNWHDGVSNSKFVKSLLLWIPMGFVYGVTAMLDSVIFNLIEFWGGSNPISMNEGDHESQLVCHNGVDYRIDATKDTFTFTQLSGEEVGEVRIMKFDRATRTWKYSDSQVCEHPVMTFLDDQAENVRVYTDTGSMDLHLDDAQARLR
ncbi:MAG: DUF3332 family protein [Flavobacteriales bacterium]|nr:DUF3332 family protein [Flavobacteriales bacterium]